MVSPACSTRGTTTVDVIPPTPPGPALPAPGVSTYTRKEHQHSRRPSPSLLPVQCCGQLSHGTAAGTVIGNSALMGTYVRDEYRLFHRFSHRIPVLFPGFQRHNAQISCQGLLQVSVLQATDHLDHCQAASIAPAPSLFLHPIGIRPMVAFTSPQPFPTFFQSLPQRQRSQPFPVTFQISPQFPDVLFLSVVV